MWKGLRLAAGMSQEELSTRALCRREDIIDIEKGRKVPTSTQALLISEVLNAPQATARYCFKECAIGEKYCYNTTKKPLTAAILAVEHHFDEAGDLRVLRKIAHDGIITQDEIPYAEQSMMRIMLLEKTLEELKLSMSDVLDIPQLVKTINEKQNFNESANCTKFC